MSGCVRGVVACRAAVRADRAAVVGLGDVLDGLDYLPHHYTMYMDNPHLYHCYVVTVDERVVGFCYSYIPGARGDCVVSGGGRIHEEYKGLNLMTKLLTYSTLQKLKSIFVGMENIKQFLQSQRLSETTNPPYQPSLQEFLRELESESTKIYLFSHDIIPSRESELINPDCLKLVYQNHRVVATRNITDRTNGPTQTSLDPAWSALSISSIIPCQAGLRVDLEFYGDDQKLVQSHVYQCLEYVKEKYPAFSGDVHLAVYFSEEFELTSDDVFGNYLKWNKGLWNGYSKQALRRMKVENLPSNI